MDLLAYLSGEEVEEVLKKNGIEIPRFRGKRILFKAKFIRKIIGNKTKIF